tara:strand:+ start:769 stop:1179 length:411 start_codon:yes stop_codon:yes gene_type:complete
MSSLLDNFIDSSKICIFSKESCPYCVRSIQLLKTKYNITPQIIDIGKSSQGPQISQALRNITGQKTVPNIFIFGKHIGGYSQLETLDLTGELKFMLNSAYNQSPMYQCEFCGIEYNTPTSSCNCFPRNFDDWGAPL